MSFSRKRSIFFKLLAAALVVILAFTQMIIQSSAESVDTEPSPLTTPNPLVGSNGTYSLFSGALPCVGSPKVVVFAINFADGDVSQFPNFVSDVEELFFDDTYKTSRSQTYEQDSLRSFYYRSSYGKLDITGDVFTYTTKNPKNSYTDEYQIIDEVMEYAGSENALDWDKYDVNQDGYIDGVYFVLRSRPMFGGPSQITDCNYVRSGKRIAYASWCHNQFLNSNSVPSLYIIQHETCHMLGLKDIYAGSGINTYTGGSLSTGGAGVSSIMNGGQGSPYGDIEGIMKYLFNWIEPQHIAKTGETQVTLASMSDQPELAIIYANADKNSMDWFIVEYITSTNDNLHYGNAHGLTQDGGLRIWRVKMKSSFFLNTESVFNIGRYGNHPGQPFIYLDTVRPDGINDYFFYPGDSFTPVTTLNSNYPQRVLQYSDGNIKLEDLADSGVYLENIQIDNGRANFTVTITPSAAAVTPVAADFTVGNLNQIVGNVTAVTISPQAGKSQGVITIYYNGSTTIPQAAGSYPVTFDVAADATNNFTAASGLSGGTLVVSAQVNAGAPNIGTQPKGDSVTVGTTHNLTVVATSPDGGTLSYQWYSNTSAANSGGSSIGGATNATYAAPINTAGTYYYYVVVTNTIANNGDGGTKTATTASSAVTLTVTVPTYAVTVLSGTGGGSYAVGANVTIMANAAPVGQQFKEWTTTSNGVSFTSAMSAITTFTMPGNAVTVTATYEAIPPTVSGVAVNPSAKTLAPGDTFQFSMMVSGTNNPPQTVIWDVTGGNGSSTIAQDGTLAVDGTETDGTTLTVTASSTLAGYTGVTGTATVTISAIAPTPTVTSVSITPSTITLNQGDTHTFSAVVNGTNGPSQAVIWAVENSNGTTAITTGGALTIAVNESATTLTVRATSVEDGTKSGTATATVYQTPVFVAVTNITDVPTTAIAGTVLALSGTVVPSDATNQTITWSINSAGTTGAWVSGNTLNTTAAGTMTVTATVAGGTVGGDYTQNFPIAVSASSVPVSSITVTGAGGATTITVKGGTLQMAAAVLPSNGSNRAVTWSITSGGSYASVNSSTGLLSAAANGTVTVRATANDGSGVYGQATITISGQGGGGGGSGRTMTAQPSHSYEDGINTHTQGSGKQLIHTVEKNFSLFSGVKVNGKTLKQDTDYKAVSGSTVITLYDDYLDTLSVGKHTLSISFSDGVTVTADFTVAKGETKIEPWGNPFTDVRTSDWFYGDVEYVYTHGLMSGTSTSPMLFSSNTPLTRGMIVTILYRHADSPNVSGLANPFDDVPAGQYYTDAVKWATANGIVSGIGGGKYAPNNSITRQDLAVILYRYASFKKITLPVTRAYAGFNDGADIASYAKEAVEAFYKVGIASGNPGNMFDPKDTATRAEAAAMLHRLLGAEAK